MRPVPIPAILNCHAGTAAAAAPVLAADDRFELHEVEPAELHDSVRAAIAKGARRVLVCGGDGSIASAAAVVANTGVALAVLPGGTLNHFARDHGIPLDPAEALDTAAGEATRLVDVGFVNDRLFLNTSSVGAYVSFVRARERLERWLGYRAASFVAALRLLMRLRGHSLVIELEDGIQHYHTALVFIGVGERELAMPLLGSRVQSGRGGLHALVVSGRAPARILALLLAAAARGVKTVSRRPRFDSFLLERCTVEMPGRSARVAADGEIVTLAAPLRYRVARGAFVLVAPDPR